MLVLLYWRVVPICWHCHSGECFYILALLNWRVIPTCWDCYTGGVFLDVGIAILASGPYMLALLLW